jgi:hypothetical protein
MQVRAMSATRKEGREALRARKKERHRKASTSSNNNNNDASSESSNENSSNTASTAVAAVGVAALTGRSSGRKFKSSSPYKYDKHRARADASAVFRIDDDKTSAAAKGALVDEEALLRRLSVADIYVYMFFFFSFFFCFLFFFFFSNIFFFFFFFFFSTSFLPHFLFLSPRSLVRLTFRLPKRFSKIVWATIRPTTMPVRRRRPPTPLVLRSALSRPKLSMLRPVVLNFACVSSSFPLSIAILISPRWIFPSDRRFFFFFFFLQILLKKRQKKTDA